VADPLKLEVPPRLEGDRVDKALADLLDLSRAQARALIDEGVLIDGAPARAGDRVRAGEVLEAPPPVEITGLEPEAVDFEVVHEDADLIVVDKPPGLVVHPGSGHRGGTLAAGLLHRYPELEGVGDPGRWGLVHRLDRDTSGLLLVGRTTAAFDRLRQDLAGRKIGRRYTTLVHGHFSTPTGTIDAPIGADPSRPTRRAVVAGGKPAVTHYEVLQEFPRSGLSLLEVSLATGRTHQIRVHMAAIDHPVVGDKTYSMLRGPETSRRIFLHAHHLSLTHPATVEPVRFTSPLPPDLAGVLDSLHELENR
jgi:23S rRNA pseudouridine1911/1915/1917 synthase